MAWAWVVARQLLLLFESDVVVARAALGCERASDAEADAALAEALLDGARVALDRLGRGGDTTKRVLGGGVANRFTGRLKPIASFLDASGASGSSRWLRGALPRQVLCRATSSAMPAICQPRPAVHHPRFCAAPSSPRRRCGSPCLGSRRTPSASPSTRHRDQGDVS